MLSNTFHFENNCPWGICSCAVCVVLDKVPSRGLSFAWHSLLGVGVSRHVGISRCFTLLNVPHYIHFVSFCGRTIIVPLYARWIDESCWIMDETVIVCIHLWGLNLGVDCMFPTFSNQFHLFSVQLHSFSAQFHSCSVRVYPFSNNMNWELFSFFFQAHLLEMSFLNVPSAISRRSQVVLVLISVSIYVRPISGHHHHTIHWFLTIHGYPWLSSGFGAVRAGAMGKELQSDLTNISNQ